METEKIEMLWQEREGYMEREKGRKREREREVGRREDTKTVACERELRK